MNIGDMAVVCVMCGYTSQQTIIFSSSSFGTPDLDTRPPETTRSGVVFHVQQCPKCHYCNSDMSEAIPGVSAAILEDEAYQLMANNQSIHPNIKKFKLAASLYKNTGDHKMAGFLALRQAWVSDDLRDQHLAKVARQTAIDSFEKHLEVEDNINYKLILLDLYRRVGEFEKCIEKGEELLRSNIREELLVKIIKYQISLAKLNDDRMHKISEVEK